MILLRIFFSVVISSYKEKGKVKIRNLWQKKVLFLIETFLCTLMLRKRLKERLSALEAEKIEATRLKDEASQLKQIAENAENSALEAHRLRKEEQKEAEEKVKQEKLEQEAKEMFEQLDSNGDKL